MEAYGTVCGRGETERQGLGAEVKQQRLKAYLSFCKVVRLYVVSLLLGSQAGTERPELGITRGKRSLRKTVHIGRMGPNFPLGFAYLAARELAAWLLTKQCPGEPAALAVCHGAVVAWGRLLAGQAAATQELLFPDKKIKIPGENMPILQKELFLGESHSNQAVSDSHTLVPCRQNAVAWAKRLDFINGVLFALTPSDYWMKIGQKSAN